MGRFVEGQDCRQDFLLPASLDDYVSEDNPVRVIAAFSDELDLHALGLAGATPAHTGRPFLSSLDDAQDLPLRLFEPGSVESAPRARDAAQYRTDVADRQAGTRLQDDRQLPA